MICLVQYLFWEATGKVMECKGKECRFYGGDTCHEKEERNEDVKRGSHEHHQSGDASCEDGKRT